MKKILNGLLASLMLITTSVLADNVLVIDGQYNSATTNVVSRLQAAGHTVTTTTSTANVPTGTGTYQQVWDLRYAAALTNTEVTNYTQFITGGGFAYFVTENPGCCMTRNNSIASLVTGLGGGSTQIGPGWANNTETNLNTTYMTQGITVNYMAVAAIVNSSGIPLISDAQGNVSGMSWIGRAGALGSGVTGTIVTVADVNWLSEAWGTQNQQALDDIITGIVAGTVGGTISASGNGAAASNGAAQQQAQSPTVVSTTTTNTVTSTDSRGTSTTTVTTVDGTATVTETVTRGTPVAVTVETRDRGVQTAKTLSVGQTFTTTTTTPVTTVTTTVTPFTTTTVVTTPVTTTTTTTPVTTTTYSDNTTTTSNGTPVVTTTVVNEVVTTTTTGTTTTSSTAYSNEVAVAAITNTYETRIDQMNKLLRANGNTNTLLDSAVTDRVSIDGDHFIGMDGPQGYVVLDAGRSNTADSYSFKSNRFGAGFDHRVDSDLIVGVQYNRHTNTMSGVNSGGQLTKDHFGAYTLHNFDGWLVKNDLAVAFNTITTNHSLPELGYTNSASTKGRDTWFASRLYTPDLEGFRPYVGVRWERNRVNATTDTGSSLTAITYDAVRTLTRNEEVGVSFEQKVAEEYTVRADINRTTLNYRTGTLAVAYQIDKTSAVDLRISQQRWDDVRNNIAQLNVNFKF
jgi:hypothetical protein